MAQNPVVEGAGFKKLHNFLFEKQDPGMKTEGFVLYQDGEVLFEKYTVGDKETRHLMWSMSKSVSSFLFGIAESKELIDRKDSIYNFYKEEIDSMPKFKAQKYKKITFEHVLSMSTGLGWKEFYEDSPFKSSIVRMLYFEVPKSTTNYVLKTDVSYEPGTRFYYSSGDTQIFMGALRKAVPLVQRDTYPWEWFFDPMEMDAIFEQDGEGTFVGASYVYLKSKDLIKLGQLVLDKGKYKGKQVVPEEYMEFATSLANVFKKSCQYDDNKSYGAQIWLNAPCPGQDNPPMRDAPADLVMFLGHAGQSIFVFPSKKVIAVRVAQDEMHSLDHNKYAKMIMGAFQ
jgi:CubicO group peptidase (beta-lactamase class C family)